MRMLRASHCHSTQLIGNVFWLLFLLHSTLDLYHHTVTQHCGHDVVFTVTFKEGRRRESGAQK